MKILTFVIACLLTFTGSFLHAEHSKYFEKNLHASRLELLKKKGFNPKVIYDIGAFKGYWSLSISQIFPTSQFHLFEANENNHPFLSALPFPSYITVLGDKESLVTFYTNNSTGDSVFCEKTKYYQNQNCVKKEVMMRTLASVVDENQLPLPDLIKFDVQGAEKLIIEGSQEIIKNAEVLILESKILEYNENAPLFFEIVNTMNSLGYSVHDILECHYLPTGELNEVDLLFIKKDSKLIKKGILIE